MEKLIELLYEYNKIAENKLWLITSVKELWEEIWFDKGKEIEKYQTYIISKSYGFIKWLVDNDKINWWRIENNQDYAEYLWSSLPIEEYGVEILLMLLAIADDPINYLCCIIRQF